MKTPIKPRSCAVLLFHGAPSRFPSSQSATGANREHEAKELIAKQFIVTCQQFRIPIKWSKEFEYQSVNSKNEPSA